MHTTTGGTVSASPAAARKPPTAEAEAKQTASAPATAARSGPVNDTPTVRYAVTASTSQPAAARPAGSTSRPAAARGSSTRAPAGGGRGKASSRPSATARSGTRSAIRRAASRAVGGAGTDGRDASRPERPGVGQLAEQGLDGVGRAEHDPVVAPPPEPAGRSP